MPCIELQIDNRWFRIDSPDTDMCGKWLADALTMYPVNPATRISLRINPYFVPDPGNPWMGPEVPDWTCDSRKLNTYVNIKATSPADAARKLAAQLTALAEELDPAEVEPFDKRPAGQRAAELEWQGVVGEPPK